MNACRACTSERLYLFLALGAHPLANGFLTEEQLAEPELTFPLDVYVCLDCGLIQVCDNVPTDFFRNYVYVPSASQAMHAHFADLADVVVDELLDGGDGLAVDIGCNDGLLLAALQRRGARTLGVDPATNIVDLARRQGLDILNEYFDPAVGTELRARYGPAAVILTTNTFHHVDDLDAFTRGVTLLLADEGVFVIEVPHALEIVDLNQFDGVYHEHVSQFTVKSVVDLARRFGLEVFRVDALPVHGGSLRLFLQRAGGPHTVSADVAAWVRKEAEKGLFAQQTYDAFRQRVEAVKEELLGRLAELQNRGMRVVGYGASARGNTLLNYFGIGPDTLDYIVDRNALKHGLYTPGMHIPVLPVERLVEDRPDCVLVLAWNFADEVLAQQAAYRAAGGRFLLPLPEPRLVT